MKQDKIHDALNLLDNDLVEPVNELRTRRRAKRKNLRWVSLAACICAAMVAVFVPLMHGMPRAIAAEDLMKGIKANPVVEVDDLNADAAAVTDFAVRLFQTSMTEGENTLVSPLSVLCALAMTANGAEGETLTQMEETLGLDVDTLNGWLSTYMAQLPQEEQAKLSLANSVWFKDDEDFAVKQEFLQTNADYYGADIYGAPMNDRTLKDINHWVDDHTDGMIPEILSELPEKTAMVLINALAFDAEWQNIYKETQVRDGTFFTENGKPRKVDMMHCSVYTYLEDDLATGFLKYYKGRDYAFVALLPNEGVSVADYAASLTGEGLQKMLGSASQEKVITAMPKFETETSLELSEVLQTMGMTDAFNKWGAADFSGIGTYGGEDLYIDKVFHKTFITVDERGTEAGAATVVEMTPQSAAPSQQEPKQVILDRPFVYMLIDCETNTPFFVGSMMDPTV